jgi:arylsulfatase A-like enzyme
VILECSARFDAFLMNRPPILPSVGKFGLGWLFGLGWVGTFQAWLGWVTPHHGWMAESTTLAVGGNMLFGLAALPVLAILTLLIRRPTAWTAGRGFAWGVAFALAPLAGGLMLEAGRYRGNTTVGMWILPLTWILAAKLPSRWLPGNKTSALGLAYCLLVWFYAGGRNQPPQFELSAGPSYESQAQSPTPDQSNAPADSQGIKQGIKQGITQGNAAANSPDVVLISLDTMRADATFGPNRAKVPTLDALAARGLAAPYARSGSNCTLPGHIEMFSGLGPLAHGILNNSGTTPADIPLLGRLFADAGWNTSAVVTNLVIEKQYGPSDGFTEWYEAPGSAHVHLRRLSDSTLIGWLSNRSQFTSLVPLLFWGRPDAQNEWATQEAERSARAARWRIKNLSQSPRPFFLMVHFMDAHAPYHAPAEFHGTRSQAPGRSFGKNNDEVRARYWEEVDYLDSQLATVVAALDATGRPYVILVTGDHGEHLGEQSMVGHSDKLFEPVVRVPFFLAGPGVPQGQLPPVSLTDVAPTLLACAGLPIPASMTGVDVRTFANQQPGQWDERLLFARDERDVTAVIGPLKYSAPWPKGENLPQAHIFRDLQADPVEGDMIQDPSDLLDAIHAQLRKAVDRSGETMSSERAASLRQMGYVDDAGGH